MTPQNVFSSDKSPPMHLMANGECLLAEYTLRFPSGIIGHEKNACCMSQFLFLHMKANLLPKPLLSTSFKKTHFAVTKCTGQL